MRSCALKSDTEVETDEPALVDRRWTAHAVQQPNARSDEQDRPEYDLAADVRDVRLHRPRFLPRAQHGRANTIARAERAVAVVDVRQRRATRAESGLEKQRDV